MGLGDMQPNDLANLMTVGGAALCSLLMVIFKSRCTQISVFWGLWSCSRSLPADDSDEEAPGDASEERARTKIVPVNKHADTVGAHLAAQGPQGPRQLEQDDEAAASQVP